MNAVSASYRHQPPIDAVGKVHWCGAIETSEDERRQFERDPLRDSKPMKVTEQWRHVVELPSTKYHPSSGVEDGLYPTELVGRQPRQRCVAIVETSAVTSESKIARDTDRRTLRICLITEKHFDTVLKI